MISDFIGIFTRNWGLKLLSLVLAIVIYYLLQPATDENKPFYRPFKYSPEEIRLNEETTAKNATPETVKIEKAKKEDNAGK